MASSEQPTPAPPEQPSGSAEQPSKETAAVEVSSQDDAKSVSKAQPASQSFFTYFQLLVYANPKWIDYVLLLVGTLSAIGSGVPFPLMGIIFGQLVDELNTATCAVEESSSSVDPKEVQASVDSKVLILTYAGIANFALIYIYTVTWSIFSRRLETRLRDRYFHMLLRQDATFYDSRQAGELATRLNADIQAVQSGTSEKVGVVLACTAFFLTSYIVAFTQNWKLACMLLSLIPAFLILAGIGSFFTQKYSTLMADAIASASSIAQESLSHIAVVQAFSAGPRLETKFAARMLDARKWGIRKALVAGAQAGMLYFIAYSANALAFWQGSVQIAAATHDDSGVSVGKIYTVIFLLVDACIILGSIAPILPILGSAGASFYKLRQDIDSRAAIDSSSDEGEKLQVPISGHLSFQGITFAYVSRPDRPVLKNVSFECPAGKHTALVGLSGSGKSTIAGLTARLYDPTEGTVFLDGHDLRTLNVRNLRSFMSLVQQEPSLLDRSILENIALGIVNSPQSDHQKFQPIILGSDLAEVAAKLREGKDINEVALSHGEGVAELVKLVRHAASLADASGFIDRLEYGYGTLVGTGGKLVSGGQRQRIALARALIRDPQILILDEATASLDSASEHRIQMAVESIAKDRTLISIAHRLSTIKNADNIIVMNSGLIVEQGTHLELMALDGAYASMVRLQNIEAKKNDDTPSLTSTARGDADEKDSILEAKPKAILEDTNKEDEKKEDSPESGANADEAKPADVADLDSEKSAWFVTKSVGRMARPDLFWIIIAMCAALIVGATFTASGLIFGNTVNHVSPCKPESEIRWAGKLFGGMFFMLAVVEVFAYTLSWSGFGYVAEKLLYLIRVLSFRSLYEQGLEWHQSGGRTATSLLSVITTDAAAVGAFSGSIMGTMFSISINFVIAVILSHILNWKIALVCLVTMPILLGSGIMQMRSLASFERRHANAFSNAVGISVEAVNSFKTVSSLSLEDELMGCYRRALKAPRKEVALASAYTNLWLAISNSAGGLVYALAYWWGSKRITAGEATQTDFFIILICMLVSAQLWGQMFSLAPEVSRARAAASRILSLIDLSSAHDLSPKEALAVSGSTATQGEKDIEAAAESSKKATPGQKGTTITFKDVGFSYPARPHIPILKGMSFTIQSGQFCGLVGPSGAGKSTIMSLVQRMYTPSSGTVEIDGMDIMGREGTEFRDDIAVVPQDCALFEGTIRFNVGLGARSNQEATEEEIHEACRLANIHDTIMALPDQYDTECGPNGSRLSGGQRQRLAIARALVRKPRLLLLDESTSALDAESERALQEGLERAARGITTIAITHRLHTVRKADVIFVVEGGQVVEKGRHEELVATSETYRVNALQQMLGD